MMKTTISLSIVIALRFLGLFIVIPTLSVYALSLEGSTEILAGVTIGVYAISQMIMQIPLGSLSDKIGRKQVIFIGTIIFILGSLICAYSDSIYMLILGRFIQGSGAIGAVATAMIADLTKEENRTKSMAVMGAIIAMSFAISMIAGPLIGGYYGVDKLFLFTVILGILSLFVLFIIPNSPKVLTPDDKKVEYKKILLDSSLFRMNVTNFLQKTFMTMAFMSIPIIMSRNFGWDTKELWKLYLPAMLCGLFAMVLAVRYGEIKKKSKEMLIIGVILFAISFILMGYPKTQTLYIAGAIVFFFGFNMHEPLMQSLASKYAKVNERGVSLGIFNVFGYFGTFLGGIVGGFFLKHYSVMHISQIVFALCVVWIILLATLKNPAYRKNIYLSISQIDSSRIEYLNDSRGIIEWYINTNDDTIVIRYDSSLSDEKTIYNIIKG